jgi:hypothetical protein
LYLTGAIAAFWLRRELTARRFKSFDPIDRGKPTFLVKVLGQSLVAADEVQDERVEPWRVFIKCLVPG